MNITMTDTNLNTIGDVEQFVNGVPEKTFSSFNKKETYEWVKNTLTTCTFRKLKKKERGKIRKYVLGNLTITPYKRSSFVSRYSPMDIVLLCTTDNAHSRLNGHATQQILERAYTEFGHTEYENSSKISVPHLYRLRETRNMRQK